MTTIRIQSFPQPFTCADGSVIRNPAYHVLAITDEGVTFRHFYRFEGWQVSHDDDGNEVIINTGREARDRARALAAHIEAAVDRDDVYALSRQYWDLIPVRSEC